MFVELGLGLIICLGMLNVKNPNQDPPPPPVLDFRVWILTQTRGSGFTEGLTHVPWQIGPPEQGLP